MGMGPIVSRSTTPLSSSLRELTFGVFLNLDILLRQGIYQYLEGQGGMRKASRILGLKTDVFDQNFFTCHHVIKGLLISVACFL